MDLLLGGCDCGFSGLVKGFCNGGEASMAERRQERASVFPLPLPNLQTWRNSVSKKDGVRMWLFLVVFGLNYLNGGYHCHMSSQSPTVLQSEILEYLEGRITCLLEQSFSLEKFDWSKFLQTCSVSYSNEEVRTAKWTTWANIEPALPLGSIASIAAVDLAEGGVLDLLVEPQKYLVPSWNDEAVKASRVMVHGSAYCPWLTLITGFQRLIW